MKISITIFLGVILSLYGCSTLIKCFPFDRMTYPKIVNGYNRKIENSFQR
jgi:hypothetical protein